MVEHITEEEWVEQIKKDPESIILDVRTQEEVDESRLDYTKHIDIRDEDSFLDEVENLDRSKNYYIYCRSGARSAKACEIMDEMGFENTYNLLGGIINWTGPVKK